MRLRTAGSFGWISFGSIIGSSRHAVSPGGGALRAGRVCAQERVERRPLQLAVFETDVDPLENFGERLCGAFDIRGARAENSRQCIVVLGAACALRPIR